MINQNFVLEVQEVSSQLDNLKLNVTPKPSESKQKKPLEKHAQLQSNTKNSADTSDPEKKLKNLKKRLREIESLEEKVKNGSLVKPEPEQLTKIKRKNDLLLQIHELEKQINWLFFVFYFIKKYLYNTFKLKGMLL